MSLLEIKQLTSAFLFEGKPVPVVTDVSITVEEGEILGLVGESGSGKSVTAKNVMRLLPTPPASVLSGEILFKGRDILKLSEKEMRSVRGNEISMIFQEPMTSLNPVYTCGNQIMEAVMLHQHVDKKTARAKAEEMLKLVGMSMPEERLKNYPHELSGGMRQRVMIAMALCSNPSLLIADEPTTALDPTIQAQILELIGELQKKLGMSVLYITHDLGVVAKICDKVAVVYAGEIVESGTLKEIYTDKRHPYTIGLFDSLPDIENDASTLKVIQGMVPDPANLPDGCKFHPRCPYATEACQTGKIKPVKLSDSHMVRCNRFSDTEV